MKGKGARRGPAMAAALLAAAAAAALGGSGCASRKPVLVDFSETPRSYLPKDYEHVYERWTRHEQALHDVDTALEAWVTFKSWDFREAYIERYAAIYSLSEADRATLRQAQLASFHEAYEFHATAQSTNWGWNDLEKASSPWRMTLIDALGHELTPESVKVQRLPDAYEREFFPHKNPFTKTYDLRFVVPAGTGDAIFTGLQSGSITLRMASPIGQLALVWQSG